VKNVNRATGESRRDAKCGARHIFSQSAQFEIERHETDVIECIARIADPPQEDVWHFAASSI
jgi:hypothetical protein